MGVVWKVRHVHSGLMGALKVRLLKPSRHGLSGWREVDALARLDHPNIIAIYDQGLVPDVSSAPYYVMALAQASLKQVMETRALVWPEVHAVLEATTRALCHLHAFGLLHRDVKPDNVLLMGHEVTRANVRLADFGLVAAADSGAGGTPRFMAPEQHRGQVGSLGPWTDLYALGLLGWLLVSGRLPVEGAESADRKDRKDRNDRNDRNDRAMLALAHELEGPPRLEPRFEVPAGLEPLLRRLLAKPPEARPYCAATVLAELRALDGEDGERVAGVSSGVGVVGLDGATMSGSFEVEASVERSVVDLVDDAGTSLEIARLGSGLGLVGRRVYPLVGRSRELAALQSAALRTMRSGMAEAIGVTGPDGMGKRRLIDAFAGALAERFPTRVTRLDDLDDTRGLVVGLLALPSAVSAHSPLVDARLAQLRAPTWVAATVREVLSPSGQELGHAAGEGRDTVSRDVAALGWIVAHLPELALVVTNPRDEVAPESLVGRLLDGAPRAGRALFIANRPGESLALEALSPEDTLFLTREVLELEAELAAAISATAAGHPGTLVALVRSLVEADALRLGPHGWTVPEPERRVEAALRSLGSMGSMGHDEVSRLDLFGASRADAGRTLLALSLAGFRPTLEQLAAVLRVDRVDPIDLAGLVALVTRLAAHGLVVIDADRVQLARPALGSALAATLAAGVVQSLHAAWADVLRHEVERGSVAERARRQGALAAHLEVLGAPDLGPVALAAARLHLERGAPGEALLALKRTEAGAVDRGEVAVVRAEALVQLGRHDEAMTLLERHPERVDARWLLGQLARLAGRHEEALAAYDAVLSQQSGDLERARTRLRRSMALRELGRLEASRGELVAADVLRRSTPLDQVLWLRAQAHLLRSEGRPEEQRAAALEAVALAESLGSPGDLGAALTDLAGSANQLGRTTEALDALTRSYGIARALGRADQAIDQLNLGLVHLNHGTTEDADRYLAEAIVSLGRLGWRPPLGAAHTLRLVSLARLGRWEGWAEHLEAAERLLAETGVKDPDVKRALAEARELVAMRGEPALVERVASLLVAQG
jgi:tetratricopeptide (TPR) repeat protein